MKKVMGGFIIKWIQCIVKKIRRLIVANENENDGDIKNELEKLRAENAALKKRPKYHLENLPSPLKENHTVPII